jgi:hypothetical protein
VGTIVGTNARPLDIGHLTRPLDIRPLERPRGSRLHAVVTQSPQGRALVMSAPTDLCITLETAVELDPNNTLSNTAGLRSPPTATVPMACADPCWVATGEPLRMGVNEPKNSPRAGPRLAAAHAFEDCAGPSAIGRSGMCSKK